MSDGLSYVLVFLARVADVSLSTLRLMLVFRGQRLLGSLVGLFEVSIYIVALGFVVERLHEDPITLLFYALGFASGSYLGGVLEERLALGVEMVQVIPHGSGGRILAGDLRQQGYGVTELEGQGREGHRTVLLITVERKRLPQLLATLREREPQAFVTVLDTRRAIGGVLTGMRKGK
ncbi:DUF2179 domain-containing protein [Thermaerobacter subterraneus]|uniref:UPF0316 protein ThesuDRAFT_00622 n=1 Tax=Thermaerobacter subterraneus DSM 13965 TaxID=867903 RepID=K6Q1P9_9FIRM|nr:DUF5698 domain-containing protein [Thermaerobacter subterraneus]EKP94909.1 hypothetical protein ThesuDRAFT_00622 [Thermaerobacter subterraneus DSM 13965]